VTKPRPSTYAGDVNVSYYTREQLSTGIGTLFGAHLKRDAKIVWDKHGQLTRAVADMGEVDTDRAAKCARVEAILAGWDAHPDRVRALVGWQWILDALEQLPTPTTS